MSGITLFHLHSIDGGHVRHYGNHANKVVDGHLPRLSRRRVYPKDKNGVAGVGSEQANLLVEKRPGPRPLALLL